MIEQITLETPKKNPIIAVIP